MIHIEKKQRRKTILDLNKGAKGLHAFSSIYNHSAVLSHPLLNLTAQNDSNLQDNCFKCVQ